MPVATEGALPVAMRSDHPDYDRTLRKLVWNGRQPTLRPAAIVSARTEADVINAVRIARAEGLSVGIRSGGHNWFGASLRDGGMTIDLSRLSTIEIDVERGVARVEPGATSRTLARALDEHGVAFPVGHCPSVGVGGYLLSGGFGWNSGEWGIAAHAVRAIRAVDASGEVVVGSMTGDPDLLWLARGAGMLFPAIVTQFEIQLFPRSEVIVQRTVDFPWADAEDVGLWFAAATADAGVRVEPSLRLFTDPGLGPLVRMTAVAFGADAEDGAALLAGIFDSAPPNRHRDSGVTPTTIEALHSVEETVYPEGARFQVDNATTALDFPELVRLAVRAVETAPSPESFVGVGLGTAEAAEGSGETLGAFSLWSSSFLYTAAVWRSADDDGDNLAWVRDTMGSLAGKVSGRYVAEAAFEPGHGTIRDGFTASTWKRIDELRRRFDPDGRFAIDAGRLG